MGHVELRRHGVQELAMAITIVEFLMQNKKEDSSKPKPPSKGNHGKGGGNKG